MQIVIKIDEELYKAITTGNIDYYDALNGLKAIASGTPLPKNHGRLIDADKFQMFSFNKVFDNRLSEGGLATINMYLDLQPTIIEEVKADADSD